MDKKYSTAVCIFNAIFSPLQQNFAIFVNILTCFEYVSDKSFVMFYLTKCNYSSEIGVLEGIKRIFFDRLSIDA
jgi:hypothetical protein